MKNRMIAWVSGVVLVVVTLMVIIVKLEPPRDGIIRAQAMKAMALALTDKEECEKRAKERGTSHFSAKEKDNWFVKYMDYLYDEGYLDPELTPASLASASISDQSYAVRPVPPETTGTRHFRKRTGGSCTVPF